jgi:hypothetical protein
MSTISKQTENSVPVGKTPVPKDSTWDEHRDAMHQDATARRTTMERRQARTATKQRSLV